MQVVYRLLLWTLVFCRFTSQEESCSGDLGMQSKRIPDGRITASSSKSSVNSPHFARLDGAKAWCSAPKDKLPYIQITFVEPKSITGITTQGSKSDFAWVKKYEVKYLDKGTWKEYDKEFEGNNNINGLKSNTLDPPIRTQLIRIYPKDPIVLGGTDPKPCCLRLELSGCSAPAVCRDPGMPDNGTRIGENFGDGQMVAYRCNPTFNLVGSPTSFCIAGHWNTTKPTCKASCLDPGIPSHARRIGSNFGHGGQVTFVCLKDFTRLGIQSMTCHDGKWSSIIPVCKAVCVDPGKPVNGSRIGDTFLDGQAVAFSCRPSHTLIGAPILRCIAGKWNKPTPKCKARDDPPSLTWAMTLCTAQLPVASCKDPGTPKNGVRHGTEFTHNKRISFACLAGFQLTGTANVVCINGKWSASTPQCKAVCVDPGKPVNGSRIGDTFLDGQAVAFSCRPSHTLIGAPILRCVAGKWNKPTPKCKASCPDLVAPINGRAIDFKPGYRHGEQAKFSCDSGFKLIGSSNIRCLDGKWSSTTPFCKASCPDPGIPVNGERVNGSFAHGKHLQFRCKPGFWLVGSQLIVCREASCPDPGIPRHGRRIGSNFGHGGQVTFGCLKDFTRLGSQSMTCHDGKWSSVVPVCKGKR
ncbi:CUB and sushi domain-containing protein 3 [Stylophora pistillata]|uniref:CUB and sushi domain-containing protein 3 n=1 Tax=Stylophora pistillata TaxID=50429 RepID=A0A2B4SZQ5_STYPI|nr:CUB and sushi domain-containing protein 3 [Stylophora pistillata]